MGGCSILLFLSNCSAMQAKSSQTLMTLLWKGWIWSLYPEQLVGAWYLHILSEDLVPENLLWFIISIGGADLRWVKPCRTVTTFCCFFFKSQQTLKGLFTGKQSLTQGDGFCPFGMLWAAAVKLHWFCKPLLNFQNASACG